MHSSYQHHETHYGDMSLSVHERISDLHRRARGLAPAVEESALDSGFTDERPAGPRQCRAWDMVAEAHGWNAISDSPELLARAEHLERDGIAYRIDYAGGMDPGISPWEIVTGTPQPEVAEGDTVIFDSVRATVVGVYPAGPGNPYAKVRLQYEATGSRETVAADAVRRAEPQDEIWTRIQVLAAKRDEGRDWTPQLEDEYYRLLGQRYDPDGSHNLREPQPRPASTTPRDLDQAQHEASQAYLAGSIGVDEWRSAIAAIEEERNAQAERLAAETDALITGLAEKYPIDGVPACGAPVDGGRCGRHPHHDGHPHIKEPGTEEPKRYGAGRGFTIEQARAAFRQVGDELQANAGRIAEIMDAAGEPEPQHLETTITRQALRSLPGQPRRAPWIYSYTSPVRQEFKRGDGSPYVIEQGQTVEYGTSLSVLKSWLRRKFSGVKITVQF